MGESAAESTAEDSALAARNERKTNEHVTHDESGFLSGETRTLLRQSRYRFKKADAYLSQLEADQQTRGEIDGAEKMSMSQSIDIGKTTIVNTSRDAVEATGGTNACVSAEDVAGAAYYAKGLSERRPGIFENKLILAPLTTVGNLPFRRVCKGFGADVTVSEMALATKLLQGQQSEWSMIRRHASEDIFGVQIAGTSPSTLARAAEVIESEGDVDFIDLNCGCPIDGVCNRGAGASLMRDGGKKLKRIAKAMSAVMVHPLTVKIRTGIYNKEKTAHKLIPSLRDCGVSLITMHGRSKEARYTKLADWAYIDQCAELAKPLPFVGNGDILSFEDAYNHKEYTRVSSLMIGRGALIKPWLFTEIKEQRTWDISSSERFDILKDYARFGLEYGG